MPVDFHTENSPEDDVTGYFTPVPIPTPNPDAPSVLPPAAILGVLHIGLLGAVLPPPARPGPRPGPLLFGGH